jgi:hypothetical protein
MPAVMVDDAATDIGFDIHAAGDMDHFDLSIWAFEKLASTKWGVIAL